MKHKHDGAEGIFVKVSRNQGRETKDFATSVHHNYFHKIDAEQETIGIKSSGNEVGFCYQFGKYCKIMIVEKIIN